MKMNEAMTSHFSSQVTAHTKVAFRWNSNKSVYQFMSLYLLRNGYLSFFFSSKDLSITLRLEQFYGFYSESLNL